MPLRAETSGWSGAFSCGGSFDFARIEFIHRRPELWPRSAQDDIRKKQTQILRIAQDDNAKNKREVLRFAHDDNLNFGAVVAAVVVYGAVPPQALGSWACGVPCRTAISKHWVETGFMMTMWVGGWSKGFSSVSK
jgi:hypothetical protein